MNSPYLDRTRKREPGAKWRPQLRSEAKLKQVVRVALATRLWLRAGTGHGWAYHGWRFGRHSIVF